MRHSFEWKVGGQQGEGVDSTGEIFAKTLFRHGYYVSTYKQFMSRIKGGHTNYKVRATVEKTHYAGEKLDVLLCLDQETYEINKHELSENAMVLMEGEFQIQEVVGAQGLYQIATFPFKKLAAELGNPLAKNMISLGVSAALMGLPKDEIFGFIQEIFEKKGKLIVEANQAAIDKGYQLCQEHLTSYIEPLEKIEKEEHLFISGNEATAFGSLMAGCRFLSAYPITPASDVMEWLSSQLPKVGGTIMQVEDEIAGITFAIGASYAGARAMTSTSGPGLSLKTEALGLAGMSETPLVIVNSQRSGPSTGLPTKHEQSDLQHMLHAAHGEIPRIILYPSTAEDAFYLAIESFNLAEQYQCPVFLALDLAMSMNRTTIPVIDSKRVTVNRGKLITEEQAKEYAERTFKRYRFTEDGISPRVLPGMPSGVHTASSNEHGEDGYINEDPFIRTHMMEKRLGKIQTVSIQTPFYIKNEEAEIMLVGMGSTRGMLEELVERFAAEGLLLGHLHIQQLHPLPVDRIAKYLMGKKVISIENNYEGQLLNWLKQHFPIHQQASKITQYDGNPFELSTVYSKLKEML